MKFYRNCSELVTLQGAARKEGRHIQETDLGRIRHGSLLIDQGKILWTGEDKKLPRDLAKSIAKKKNLKEFNMKGSLALPGWIESHTHTIFAGSRAEEFELRNQGMSYQEIAQRGGGILSTMKHTRQASPAELLRTTQKRVDEFVRQGVCTLEVKTGYALDLKNEVKCLQVIQRLQGPQVIGTFLGAHARPPEFSDNSSYLDFLAQQVWPKIKKQNLAQRIDIFVEKAFFNFEESQVYLQKARDMGFQVVVHADQLTLSGGSQLAVDVQALSADHVLQVSEVEIKKLAASEVTAVLLPAADLYMRCAYPKARAMIEAGVRVALATDFNPGSSPTQDLALVGLLARLEMKMTLAEVIAAYTVGAAFALELQSRKGSLDIGKDADICFFENDLSDLFYSVGSMNPKLVLSRGKVIN